MLSNIDSAALRDAIGNLCFGSAGLTNNAAALATASAVPYTVGGRFLNLAIQATISTAAVYNVTAMKKAAISGLGVPSKVAAPVNPGGTRVYAVAVNADGVKIFEDDGVTADTASQKTPAIPADMAALGVVKVQVGTGAGAAAFQLGTTALATNAPTKLTVTFFNTSILAPGY